MKRIIILMAILVSSCSPIRFVNRTTLSDYKLMNDSHLSALDLYIGSKDLEGAVILLMTKDINRSTSTMYINHIMSVSKLYILPFSFVANYKGKKVIIYSKKDGYINPRLYPSSFINEMKTLIDDDFNLIQD